MTVKEADVLERSFRVSWASPLLKRPRRPSEDDRVDESCMYDLIGKRETLMKTSRPARLTDERGWESEWLPVCCFDSRGWDEMDLVTSLWSRDEVE